MSQKIDKFIRQHQSYFDRNKQYLELNEWHITNVITTGEQTDEEEEETQRRASKRRKTILSKEADLVTNILSRLKAFIRLAEGDRHLKKVQNFINETVEIIDIFIHKCEFYVEDNPVDAIESDYKRSFEISRGVVGRT